MIIDSIVGHTHRWPNPSNGNQADEVWAILKQYSLAKPTAVPPQASTRPGLPIKVSYAAGIVHLAGLREEARVEVTDTRGELSATMNTRQRQFAFTGASGGVYLVTVRASGGTASKKIIIP